MDLSTDKMYEALVERDSTFEGIFYVGVKTTGIFCRPTCTAKKPHRKNVEFFPDAKAAIDHGFRPCKICTPMRPPSPTPEYISVLLRELELEPDRRITDSQLAERGLDPVKIRRWFKKTHGMTFQAFQRSMRINSAFGHIRNGESITQAAYGNGFESLSGFQESFQRITGFTPGQSPGREVIVITRLSTPLGPMLAGVVRDGLCLLEFSDRPMLETQLKRIHKRYKARTISGKHNLFDKVQRQLNEYFEGARHTFDLPLEMEGSRFQRQVWNLLLDIPYGTTRSYKAQAQALGNPNAVRAVARANGDNRIAIIIPCHRVIGSNGHLTGYGGGIWRKKYLLDLEGG